MIHHVYKIYIGGDNEVIILNIDGTFVREITTDRGVNYNLLYNERNDQLLLRQDACLLNTISRNVPSGDNLRMSCAPLMYT
jgi:hypothetical protein